ncbi:MAG TPA: PAS domain S-box protein, partial [Gallionella sp.]|nr:PAS domain S-box protein [Gallionella sp.]
PAVERLSGKPAAMLLGKTATEAPLIPEVECIEKQQSVARVLETGLPAEIGVRYAAADGKERYFQNILVPEFGLNGEVTSVLSIARDITARKIAEDALRASEERMRLFFERQLVGMAITSPEKGWLQVNDKVCDMLGYSFDELKKLSWAEVTHPEDLPLDESQFEQMLNGEFDSYTVEKRYIRKDGGIVHAALSIGCVRRADGAVDYVLALIEDVTERKRYETELKAAKEMLTERNAKLLAYQNELEQRVEARTAELRASNQQLREEIAERKQAEERLSATAANVPGFIFTVRVEPDGHTSFPFASSGVEDLFGVSPADIRRDAGVLRARYHPDDLPRLLDLMAETERTLGLFRIEIRIENREHRYVWTEIRSMPKRLPDGATEWHGIMLDISARKQAELELEESRTQLRGLLARYEAAREEERKRIARDVHDDLGQILTGLQLNVAHLSRLCAIDESPLCDYVDEIETLTDQAVSVARDVATALRPAELDAGIVPALALQARRFGAVTGIPCECTFHGDEIQLEKNCAIALFRIVQESLTNIAKHAQADHVSIDLSRDAGDCVLTIRDNGIGFDVGAKKENAFGLVGIRERVLSLGGTVNIDSRPGGGTGIMVRIPERINHD